MSFSALDRTTLLAIPGVGAGMIKRLEQLGYASLAELRGLDVDDLLSRLGETTCSTCWQTSDKARAAMTAILARANTEI